MEPAKVIIFVGFFALFLVLSRKIFSSGKTYDPSDLPPPYPGAPEDDAHKNQPVLIGADLPFPISLPPLQVSGNGRYNRPNVRNYYFKKLDLIRGPEDPRSFCDEFFIEFESPETGAIWTNEYLVATPTGLKELMDSEHQDGLFLDGTTIIVPRWDVTALLKIILADVMERYAAPTPTE